MKKAVTDFIVEASIRYSDNASNAMEKRFVFRPGMTIDDFMKDCQEAYSMMRFACGVEDFDSMTVEEYEVPKSTATETVE